MCWPQQLSLSSCALEGSKLELKSFEDWPTGISLDMDSKCYRKALYMGPWMYKVGGGGNRGQQLRCLLFTCRKSVDSLEIGWNMNIQTHQLKPKHTNRPYWVCILWAHTLKKPSLAITVWFASSPAWWQAREWQTMLVLKWKDHVGALSTWGCVLGPAEKPHWGAFRR